MRWGSGERDWEGDAELATALAAEVNDGPTPMLRPLPVDLEELASVLEGDPVHGGGRIDLRTGEVWPHFVFDDVTDDEEEEDDDAEDDSRWLWVDPQGSRQGYRDMELFIDTVDDPALVDRLTLRLLVVARSVDSRTSSPMTRPPQSGGTPSARTGSVAAPEPGSLRRDTSQREPCASDRSSRPLLPRRVNRSCR